MIEFHKHRAHKALEYISLENVGILLIFPGANMGYFTGFHIELSERLAVAVIPVYGEPYFVINELEAELRGMKPWFDEIVLWKEHEDPIHVLANSLKKRGFGSKKIGIHSEAPWGWVNTLKKNLPEATMLDVSKYLDYLRMIKTDKELKSIQRACKITGEVLVDSFSHLNTGITELELQRHIVTGMQNRGGERTFASVLFGERAALPHGASSERKLKTGDFILADIGCTINGYWSDCTRTVIYGEPSKHQKKIYDIVLEANNAAFDAVAPGKTCESIDIAAREIIEKAGYGKYFIHRLGHGIGLEIHEHPYLVRNNTQKLKQGMVFSDEPGIYIVNDIGVRIEDCVVCTNDGGKYLTNFPRTLQIYPIQ
jgi:Xaa-Pro dipeptidase